ncbi:unnamed protein product [Lactuca saligna]|uniref:GRF-type domain-containing protein n=1 Tax=Lactuca saligna TaxID=75948 RepID=A0AA35ZJM4_LACSI|nr:unnamed protein product [Lactuca saligna]
MCYCGDRAGMWTSWTRKNPGRRFFGCPNYMDEEKDSISFNNPVNEGEIPIDGPIAPMNVDVPISPVNALEHDNQITMRENTHVPGNEFGFASG